MDEAGAPVAGQVHFDAEADARSVTRRAVIRRAAAAGAVAWTAPVILDSLASPAAAATCGTPQFRTLVNFSNATGNSSTWTTGALSAAPSAGNTLVILIRTHTGSNNALSIASITGTSIDATVGNAPSQLTGGKFAEPADARDYYVFAWRAKALATTGAITVTFNQDTSNIQLSVIEIQVPTTPTLASNFTTGTVTNASVPNTQVSVALGAPAPDSDEGELVLIGSTYSGADLNMTPWTVPGTFDSIYDNYLPDQANRHGGILTASATQAVATANFSFTRGAGNTTTLQWGAIAVRVSC